jgi:hypothetical protein
VKALARDEPVLGVVSILERHDVRYVVVSGYVAVLLGRSRATEDTDVIVEPFDGPTATDLVRGLRDGGYWGAAMPLDDLHEPLEEGLQVGLAEEGYRVPNVGSTPQGRRTRRSRAPARRSRPAV